jgi:hypothetical protein
VLKVQAMTATNGSQTNKSDKNNGKKNLLAQIKILITKKLSKKKQKAILKRVSKEMKIKSKTFKDFVIKT